MALPGLDIKLDNGALGRGSTSNDGVAGLILTGSTITGVNNVTVGHTYQLFSLKDAKAIGIQETGANSYAYKHIKEFYSKASKGSPLWIMLTLQTTSMQDVLDETKDFATKLLDAAQGKIKLLGVSKKHTGTPTLSNGLDADVDKAMIKGQVLANKYAKKIKPFRFIVDGKSWNGNIGDLKNYKTTSYNRGAVTMAATDNLRNAAVGLILGDLASLPVHRKISRVKNGSLPISTAYLTDGLSIEVHENAWGAIHDKAYIIFRSFVGRSGYLFSSDSTATSDTDDYSSIARGRVIDKAMRIAYDTYVEEIDDEIEVNDKGQIDASIVKSLQEKIVTRIELQMKGEISGVKAFIDALQNVLSTNKLGVAIKIRPFGYKSFIDILLGFETQN